MYSNGDWKICRGSVIYSTDRKNEANKMFITWLLPVWGTGNKVQNARFDTHLTGVQKKSFYWLTKTITYNKGFPRKWKQIFAMLKTSKLRALWVLALNVTLEYFGNRTLCLYFVCLEVVSIFPPLVLVKKNTAKGKEAFQGKFFVLSKYSLVNFSWGNLSNFCQFILVCDLR